MPGDQLDPNTAQTPGMDRKAAINFARDFFEEIRTISNDQASPRSSSAMLIGQPDRR